MLEPKVSQRQKLSCDLITRPASFGMLKNADLLCMLPALTRPEAVLAHRGMCTAAVASQLSGYRSVRVSSVFQLRRQGLHRIRAGRPSKATRAAASMVLAQSASGAWQRRCSYACKAMGMPQVSVLLSYRSESLAKAVAEMLAYRLL